MKPEPEAIVFAVPLTMQTSDPGCIRAPGPKSVKRQLPVAENPPPLRVTCILGGPKIGDSEMPAMTKKF